MTLGAKFALTMPLKCFAICCVVVFGAVSCSSMDPEARDLYNRGMGFYEAQQWDSAAVHLERAAVIEPRNPGVIVPLIVAYTYLRRCEDCIEACDSLLAIDSSYAPGYVMKGLCYWDLGRYREALREQHMGIALDSLSYTAFYRRALAYSELGLFDSALADLNEAYRLSPDWDAILEKRAEVLQELGEQEAAYVDFTEWIERDPVKAELWTNRAWFYLEIGNLDSARGDLERARVLGSPSASWYRGMARHARKSGECQAALAFLDSARARSYSHWWEYVERSICLHLLGDYDMALENLGRAYELAPEEHTVFLNYGLVYRAQEDHRSAIKWFGKNLQPDSSNYVTARYLGDAYRALGVYDTALVLHERAVEADTTCAESYRSLAETLEHMDSTVAAIEAIRMAIATVTPYDSLSVDSLRTRLEELGAPTHN